MAHMNQVKKQKIAAELKVLLKNSGLKYSLRVRHHSAIVMTIKSGSIDFIGNFNKTLAEAAYGPKQHPATDFMNINEFWYKDHFTGEIRDLIGKIVDVLNNGNHDNSNSQIDYFDVGWYVDLKVGDYTNPYLLHSQELTHKQAA